VSILQLKVGWY